MKHPKHVSLVEVGLRDGLQSEAQIVPLETKLEMIQNLIKAGVKDIQVTSFVNPKKVPQMADAEELISRLPNRGDVAFWGLALNTRGVIRAHEAGLRHVEVSISSSDAHGVKNAGLTVKEAMAQGKEMVKQAKKFGMKVTASIQCTFGCVYQGEVKPSRVKEVAQLFLGEGADRLSLADTTGMGKPNEVRSILETIEQVRGNTPVGLHLHDTRGLGLVNLMAGLECGVAYFDTAFGGLGGCPFVKDAAGNIATEDTLYLLESLGIETGIDRRIVAECSKKMSAFFNRRLAGKMYRIDDACWPVSCGADVKDVIGTGQ